MFYYYAFGLNILSEVQLPMLTVDNNSNVDVSIRLGKIPEFLSETQSKDDWYFAQDNKFLIKIDEVANFLIEDGNTITIDSFVEDINHAIVYLYGSAMSALLYQRGLIIMHANGIIIDEKAVLVMAPSGYGKSTLAAAFLKRGYKVLSDDICAINIVNDEAIVYPGYTQIKVCGDMLTPLGYNINELQKIYYRFDDKYYVPLHEKFHNAPTKISQLIILDKGNHLDIKTKYLSGFEKLRTLIDNTYRFEYIHALGRNEYYFQKANIMLQNTPVLRLIRPENQFSAFDLVDKITHINTHKELIDDYD